ncbi:MAG: hypothetical protein OEW23_17190 [Candidatus Aminicenantes bacterium]|nr:hypothetical protein [Candidatus Aminicenantes bacterium]
MDQSNGFKGEEEFKAYERARLIDPLDKKNLNFLDVQGMFTITAFLMGGELSL